jgi:hypothetical protein
MIPCLDKSLSSALPYTSRSKTNYDPTLNIHVLKEIVDNEMFHFILSCDRIRGLFRSCYRERRNILESFSDEL